jgi:1,4-dihydroxy-2-naphthoate octaprenyltransferase
MREASEEPAGSGSGAVVASARDLLVHLRLHFQLLLAPIFLWGFFLGGGRPTADLALAFLVVHVCLYGGATAFNSAYDRDEGPVGGLEHPPPVGPALLPFSLVALLGGWAASLAVGGSFAAVYGGILILALAYSHPRARWKADPWASLATIFVGQGVLGFLTGWTAAGAPLGAALGATGLVGAIAASAIVAGFYPLTQLFQVEEDRARGDRTLAVAWGPARCFRRAQAGFLGGGLAVLGVTYPRYGPGETVLAAGFFLALLAAVEAWRRSFDAAAVLVNFRRAMRLNAAAALALAGYVGWHLLVG